MENSHRVDPREGAAETSVGPKRCYSILELKRICQDDYNDHLELEMKIKMEKFRQLYNGNGNKASLWIYNEINSQGELDTGRILSSIHVAELNSLISLP